MKSIFNKYRPLLIVTLFLFIGCSHSDPRLYGKWKSDLKMTMDFNEKNAKLTQRQINLFNQIYGRIEVEYFNNGKYKITSPAHTLEIEGKEIKLDHDETFQKYKVIGKNNKCVVIQHDLLMEKDSVSTIHFLDENTYWIYGGDSELTGLHIREYFTKVK